MVVGEIETLTPGLAPTVTVAVAVTDPALFVAMRVYVVVAAGVTLTEVPVTEPTPGAMLSEVAFEADQLNVALWPTCTVVGAAVKEAITGLASEDPPLPKRPN